MKIWSLILLASVINFNAISQSNGNFYSRYQGVVDSNLFVTANLIVMNDALTGTYNYSFVNTLNTEKNSKSLPVVGSRSNNTVKLKEYGKDKFFLEGSLSQQKFKGEWTLNDNQIPFNLNEEYPYGSMELDVHYLHSETKLVKDSTNSPTAELELTLIYPKKLDDNNVYDSICKYISYAFFGINSQPLIPDSMLTMFEKEYYNNYKDQNMSRYLSGSPFNWQKIITMSVLTNSKGILCLEYVKYAYSGGAHGMTNISFDNINTENGKHYNYKDIFIDNSDSIISSLLTKQLYAEKGIPTGIKLSEAGYFVDQIKPNHNLFINNSGVGFVYNSYEIAPYSYGQTIVFLEYDKIIEIIRKESLAFKLLN